MPLLCLAMVPSRKMSRADRLSDGVPVWPMQTHLMQIFLDINSDGQPLGRIAVELFNDVPIGSLRFQELAEGYEGISYQLSRFNEIGPVSHCFLSTHLCPLPSTLGRLP